MNWKNRLTNYNFWVSIVSAIILVLQALDIKFDFAYLNEVATAVLGLLVVIGIINDPTRSSTSKSSGENSTSKENPSGQNKQENFKNSKNSTENCKNFDENTQNSSNLENFSLKTGQSEAENENGPENVILPNSALPIEQKNEIVDGSIQDCLPLPAVNEEVEVQLNGQEIDMRDLVENDFADIQKAEEIVDQENPDTASKNFFNIVN